MPPWLQPSVYFDFYTETMPVLPELKERRDPDGWGFPPQTPTAARSLPLAAEAHCVVLTLAARAHCVVLSLAAKGHCVVPALAAWPAARPDAETLPAAFNSLCISPSTPKLWHFCLRPDAETWPRHIQLSVYFNYNTQTIAVSAQAEPMPVCIGRTRAYTIKVKSLPNAASDNQLESKQVLSVSNKHEPLCTILNLNSPRSERPEVNLGSSQRTDGLERVLLGRDFFTSNGSIRVNSVALNSNQGRLGLRYGSKVRYPTDFVSLSFRLPDPPFHPAVASASRRDRARAHTHRPSPSLPALPGIFPSANDSSRRGGSSGAIGELIRSFAVKNKRISSVRRNDGIDVDGVVLLPRRAAAAWCGDLAYFRASRRGQRENDGPDVVGLDDVEEAATSVAVWRGCGDSEGRGVNFGLRKAGGRGGGGMSRHDDVGALAAIERSRSSG
ncbi:hypothetical protein R3P38DRAFT_3352587 [Favolaschia claudopus]|uniref:Uncharacterized protein n=1 Tax=Favolaschia claudopus TaxID=2862362 RepID=A0AAW0C336_9AGAR